MTIPIYLWILEHREAVTLTDGRQAEIKTQSINIFQLCESIKYNNLYVKNCCVSDFFLIFQKVKIYKYIKKKNTVWNSFSKSRTIVFNLHVIFEM